MNKKKGLWITIALFNLAIVAFLGVLLRSKILFPLEFINFKYLLHAHSHFAFGGWITLALMALMVYEILPQHLSNKPLYKWLLAGILFNSVGMLVSFPFQGYAFFSILFSTLFIFITYIFSGVFIRDIIKTKPCKSVLILAISSLITASLSSVGPFTLAYLLASHSGNTLLYYDSIYTYLHFQYNGFFSLSIFVLLINKFKNTFADKEKSTVLRFSIILSLSVIPTLFISYLWHHTNVIVQYVAILGCFLLLLTLVYFIKMINVIKQSIRDIKPLAVKIGLLSMIAFGIKEILQIGVVFPALGTMVFGNRTIIIGYLHLVLLGFVSIYLLAHFAAKDLLDVNHTFTKVALIVFISGVIVNEAILMAQGLGNMMMVSSGLYTWLLWGASIWLFSGATLIIISRLKYGMQQKSFFINDLATKKSNIFSPIKLKNYESERSY